MAIDVHGRPLAEAESLLQAAQINYNTEISRPSRSFFKVDEGCLYVIRQRQSGGWRAAAYACSPPAKGGVLNGL